MLWHTPGPFFFAQFRAYLWQMIWLGRIGAAAVRDYWASFGVLVFWYLCFVALDLWRAAQLPPPAYTQSPAKARATSSSLQTNSMLHRLQLPAKACSTCLGALQNRISGLRVFRP